MPAIFLDTSYILALVNPSDQYHTQASTASQRVKPPFLTTEPILLEIGNALSRRRARTLAVATIHSLRHDAEVEVVPYTTALLDRAIALFGARPD